MIIILDYTLIVRSTVVKKGVLQSVLKEYRITKSIFNFRRKGLERLTFCNKFYEISGSVS